MQLFLGTFTRYYADGGPAREPLEVRDTEDVAGAVSSWRHSLNKELPCPLDWNESPTAPFDIAEVGETAVGALWLLAAQAMRGERDLPDDVPGDWREWPAVKQASRCAPESLPFSQAVKPDLWLPGDHDLLFQARELNESLAWIGSSEELLRDLEAMERHWKKELSPRPILYRQFKVGRDALRRLARRSVQFRLPLRRG